MNIDYRGIYDTLTEFSGATVTIIMHKDRDEFRFTIPGPVVNDRQPCTLSYACQIKLEMHNSVGLHHYHRLAEIAKSELAQELEKQKQGLDTSRCCRSARHSQGWNHDTNCPNWVVKY